MGKSYTFVDVQVTDEGDTMNSLNVCLSIVMDKSKPMWMFKLHFLCTDLYLINYI